MEKRELIAKLNRDDMPGVGCVVTHPDGRKIYYFYEDFENDPGIERAAHTFERLIQRGYVRRVDYIHKDNAIHFFDWDEKPGTFSATEEFVRYCTCYEIPYRYQYETFVATIDGRECKFDYTGAIDGISAIITEEM